MEHLTLPPRVFSREGTEKIDSLHKIAVFCAFSFRERCFLFLIGGELCMDDRLGVVGIVVEDTESAELINSILHEYSKIVVGRMGIPYREKGVSVISLIVDGSNDDISAMTGRLGRVKGVSVKSALTKGKV
jgi:putative iron-only hydrogenase system regulator